MSLSFWLASSLLTENQEEKLGELRNLLHIATPACVRCAHDKLVHRTQYVHRLVLGSKWVDV